jgi:hypothetical protein
MRSCVHEATITTSSTVATRPIVDGKELAGLVKEERESDFN